MLLVRLAKGLVKGLLLGALVGWALAAAGYATLAPLIAYPMGALVGVVMALIAGKAIWEKDARIEVGMKALAGALLGPGLMWAVRHFLTMGLPIDPNLIPGVTMAAAEGAPAIGAFALTSLAMVAALVGGFYDADHSGDAAEASEAETRKRVQAGGPRLANDAQLEEEFEAEASAEAKQQQR